MQFDRGAPMTRLVAGADGCPPGWAVVLRDINGGTPPSFHICATFEALLQLPLLPGLIAVDMPIGLPDRVGAGGRGPEAELRQHLGGRASSVFSIPGRSAVYAASYEEACDRALETSDPPRKISIQAYHLFPKVRQIDELLRGEPGLASIVRECHPEGAFMMMNNRQPLDEPKKLKSAIHEPGLALRKRLLMDVAGFTPAFLDQKMARGVGIDDFLDACACAWVAEKMARGTAECFPAQPDQDSFGIPIAIWA
jgi:predicted RNase H-like nuclease